MEKFMNIALKEALKAYRSNDVPIGCIIVKNDRIISKAYNKKEKNNDPTAHAEIIAIKRACKKLKNWRLLDCEIYSTMEPCEMCFNAIKQARIKKIVYGIENKQFGFSLKTNDVSELEIISGILAEKSKKIVQDFFKEKRK